MLLMVQSLPSPIAVKSRPVMLVERNASAMSVIWSAFSMFRFTLVSVLSYASMPFMLVRLVASRFVKSTLSSRLYASASALPLENAHSNVFPVLTPLSKRMVLM